MKANEYARVKIECEAALGEMLEQSGLRSRSPGGTHLAEIGINKNQSSRWQLIAANADILPAGAGQIKD